MSVPGIWAELADELHGWRQRYAWIPNAPPAPGGRATVAAWAQAFDVDLPMAPSNVATEVSLRLGLQFRAAESVRDRAAAVRLVRRWKNANGLGRFEKYYTGKDEQLARIQATAMDLATQLEACGPIDGLALVHPWLTETHLAGIPVASTLLAFASNSSSIAIMDRYMAEFWNDTGLVQISLSDNGVMPTTKQNALAWLSAQRELEWGLHWLGNRDADRYGLWTVRDLEMALFQRQLEL